MKISKILLINTPKLTLDVLNNGDKKTLRYEDVYPPLGLLYLSSVLKKYLSGIEIEIFDLHFESLKKIQVDGHVCWEGMCDEKVKQFSPDLVGISVMFGASFDAAKLIGTSIKSNNNIILVAGGVHATAITANNDSGLGFCDFVCIHESEFHFLELVNYLNGRTNKIMGVVPINKQLLRNPDDVLSELNVIEELDALPYPDYEAIDIQQYYKIGTIAASQTRSCNTPFATLLTARGCRAHCKFCSVRSFSGRSVRAHSPKRVLEEIDILYNKYGIRHIDIQDDDFTFDKNRVIEIANGLIKRKYHLTWSDANGIRLGTLDDELLDKMAASGCTFVALGIESGDPNILKQMRKPLTLRILEKNGPLLDRHPEIYYRAGFITGFPGETDEERQRTFDIAKKYPWDWCEFSICQPLPNTDLYNDLLENKSGGTEKDNLFSTDYKYATPGGVSDDEGAQMKIFNQTYNYNLILNFKLNKNLAGRNVDRAVRDFERIVNLVDNHAFAWNCLSIGYEKIGLMKKSAHAKQRTQEILNTSEFWKNKYEDLDFEVLK
jgi:radical SAM superfamily enzyme YgiQ (UPF0313 family)